MHDHAGNSMHGSRARALTAGALLAALVAACGQLPSVPGGTGEWEVLLNEVRKYERTIGFTQTHNFAVESKDMDSYPFCGYAARLTLPYSYEDPAIQWLDTETEDACRARGHDADAYFRAVEAWGEVATPITVSMLAGKLDRFIYLVIHEDCHDQFDLPYGIEEPLCGLITHKGMAVFSVKKYGPFAREHRAVRNYAEAESGRVRTTISYYDQVAARVSLNSHDPASKH